MRGPSSRRSLFSRTASPLSGPVDRKNLSEHAFFRREPVIGDDAEAVPVVREKEHGDAGRPAVLDEDANGLLGDRRDVQPLLQSRRQLVEQPQGLVSDLQLPPRPLRGVLRPFPLGDPVLEAAHDEAARGRLRRGGGARGPRRRPARARSRGPQTPGRITCRMPTPEARQTVARISAGRCLRSSRTRAEEDSGREERDRHVVNAAARGHRAGREDQVPGGAEDSRPPGSEAPEAEEEQSRRRSHQPGRRGRGRSSRPAARSGR